MGPGQVHKGAGATIGQFDPSIRCIYPILARRLLSQGYAVLHFTWRINPTRKGAPPGTLKSPTTLLEGVSDLGLAARYVRAQQGVGGGALPLVLVGFSFGGPAVMAASALAAAGGELPGSPAHGIAPLAGVVTIGCGLRVGKQGSAAIKEIGARLVGGASKSRPHEYFGLDSESCVDAYAAAGVPLCMIHGLADVTVDPEASRTIFERASGPKAAVWMRGADHHARSRADDVITTLDDWVPALLERAARMPPATLLPAARSLPAMQEQHQQHIRAPMIAALEAAANDSVRDDDDDEVDEDEDEDALRGRSDAPSSEIDDEPSSGAPSAPRDAHEALQVERLRGLSVEEPLRPPAQAAPDKYCTFLNGEARTI